MNNIIFQGSTPTHKFKTPYTRVFVDSAIVTYAQNGEIVLNKEGAELTIEDNTILVELAQEETLKFDESRDVHIQIKVKANNGKVIPSNIIYASVAEVLNREVM
jgi:hypothetical protein